jgi:hypothetical protein
MRELLITPPSDLCSNVQRLSFGFSFRFVMDPSNALLLTLTKRASSVNFLISFE